MLETAPVLLKPEGLRHLETLIEELEEVDLSAEEHGTRWHDRQYTESFVSALYAEAPEAIIQATVNDWLGHAMPIIIVTGENAVQRVLKLCGTSIDPCRCGLGTFRRRFGRLRPFEVEEGHVYYRNAIHRSSSVREAERTMELIKMLTY